MSFPISVPDVDMYAGDSFSMTYVLKAGDPAAPVNLVAEGWGSWVCQFRKSPKATEAVDLQVDVSQANLGRVTIYATPAQSRALTSGVWDLQASRSSEVRTWLRGAIVHRLDVSRG